MRRWSWVALAILAPLVIALGLVLVTTGTAHGDGRSWQPRCATGAVAHQLGQQLGAIGRTDVERLTGPGTRLFRDQLYVAVEYHACHRHHQLVVMYDHQRQLATVWYYAPGHN